MAFSLRKMFSNINYLMKSGEETDSSDVSMDRRPTPFNSTHTKYDPTEPDSTSIQSLQLPESVKDFTAKKGSLSDTDVFPVTIGPVKKRKCKRLKLDVKSNQSMTESLNMHSDSSTFIENTPKHILLDCKSSEVFSERLKKFNFDKSFDSETDSVNSSYNGDKIELDSLSDLSDTDLSDDGTTIKMCRKVLENEEIQSPTPESFGDIEDKNEEERINVLQNYQMKLEKIESLLQKLLSEFQFHIEVSKIFNVKSVSTSPEPEIIPKALGLKEFDDMARLSPSWNVVLDKEDSVSKHRIKKQLVSLKENINKFVKTHLNSPRRFSSQSTDQVRNIRNKLKNKKKIKYYDFPDLREAMINLFTTEEDNFGNDTKLDSDICYCKCHLTQTDSGLTKMDSDQSDQSITSSIGNFSLDSTTLSAYSESLDLMVSYNSFQDSSLYTTLLQKSAIERITFYVQVHSVQVRCDTDFEPKGIIFHCPSCNITENDENGLLRHILSQGHCEKIHFVYKTAYIKKCMASGKEIMPSTVLNPMVMYRDDNKIVCFGDALYACSLCFEILIVGESVLMAHCYDKEHMSRKERLSDIIG